MITAYQADRIIAAVALLEARKQLEMIRTISCFNHLQRDHLDRIVAQIEGLFNEVQPLPPAK